MAQAVKRPDEHQAKIFLFPRCSKEERFFEKAQSLLAEIRPLDRNSLGLALLSIYHQELCFLIKQFPVGVFDRNFLPELKSRRLAFAISIEKKQTLPT